MVVAEVAAIKKKSVELKKKKKNGVTRNEHAWRGRKISVFVHGMPVFFAEKADFECCLWGILLELFDFYDLFLGEGGCWEGLSLPVV